ncbi:DUF3199 family protein [Halalkalibacterium halodurans]|uniref:protein YqbG n=1 Tax=Halalkalibacterium halodurans TaxID=86665 RepID=UPI001067D69E|nr:DUF3199 family protein [Halalkalibacterium halodurans]TES56182.1 DUF3199 family protein [Halalkalibacterium halodurans]
MALITPQDVKDYTTFPIVKNRPDKLLEDDILEAEIEIESVTGHRFTDPEFNPLPRPVKLAAIKLAQFYAVLNSDEDRARGVKQERFENYSYTFADGQNIQKPDIGFLLAKYIRKDDPERGVKMRMRII